MELKYYYDCSNPVRFIVTGLLVVLLASCTGSQETTTKSSIPVDKLPEILRSAQADKDTTKSSKESVKLRYKNKTTDVTIPIDPQKQDFVLELEGVERKDNDTSEDTARSAEATAKRDSVFKKRMAKNIKTVMRNFRRAQDLFYKQDYKGAMEKVNASLEVQETADALGLKGSIFFMRDNLSSAKYYWNKAVEMDPDIPVPDIPALESLIRDIKDGEESQEEAEQ